MNDIVERLRKSAEKFDRINYGPPACVMREAADEITSLRAEVERLKAANGVITAPHGTCQYEDCDQPAEFIACGRIVCDRSYYDGNGGHPKPACYCKAHMRVVVDERSPEYYECCPNCGCHFGVN